MAGLKSLAKELQSKGRYGDTILAHINPQEAGLLKALGGSGTINPYTGLPEYFKIGNIFKPVVQAVKAVQNIPGIKQVSDVATQAVKPIDQALVGLDKTVGKAIPGGWGTVANVAGSMAGLPTPMMVGLGALTGSGVMRPGRSFNLQGAILGGAMAYGASELAEYARGASDAALQSGQQSASQAVQEAAKEGVFRIPTETGDVLVNSQGQMLTNTGQIMNVPPAPGISSLPASVAKAPTFGTQGYPGFETVSGYDVGAPLPSPQPTITSNLMSGNLGAAASQVGEKIASGATSAYDALGNIANKATSLDTYSGALERGASNIGDTASGIKNLVMGTPGASQAAAATAKTLGTTSPLLATGATLYGATGLMALDEQQKYLDEAKRNQAISQAEYDQALASINQQRDYAQSVVNEYPFNPNPSRDVSIGETYYRRSPEAETLYEKTPMDRYARGGSIDDELGGDYSAMGMDQGNLQKGLFGMGYAEGGTPRFLSGGGDGMSDSIPATINNKQPARLADGEFVIPADVVSHLGNGSSKAGAKQLYSMMDKVRQARTGRKSQGKQINPRKYMPA